MSNDPFKYKTQEGTTETKAHSDVAKALDDCKEHLKVVTFEIVGDNDFNHKELCFAIMNLSHAIKKINDELQSLILRCCDKGV